MTAAPTTRLPPTDTTVLAADSVRLGYSGRTVLHQVNFRIGEGQFWFLLGPNGAGKSTLLHAILGRLPPMSGSLQRRADLEGATRIGFVPQRCDLNPSLPTTVREFVSLGLVGIPGARRAARERMSWALERSGLANMPDRDYWSLSGGQRQRALLARALIRKPAIFIVDEPTNGLDPPSQDLLMEALAHLNTTDKLTILFVTHDLPLAARYATHVALFIEGTVEAGPVESILRPDLMRRAYGLPIDLHTEVLHRPSPTPGTPA